MNQAPDEQGEAAATVVPARRRGELQTPEPLTSPTRAPRSLFYFSRLLVRLAAGLSTERREGQKEGAAAGTEICRGICAIIIPHY